MVVCVAQPVFAIFSGDWWLEVYCHKPLLVLPRINITSEMNIPGTRAVSGFVAEMSTPSNTELMGEDTMKLKSNMDSICAR